MVAKAEEIPYTDNLKTRALRREATALYGSYVEQVEQPAQAVQLRIMASEDCGFIADEIAQNSGIEYPDKAKLLCQLNPIKRLESAIKLLQQELQLVQFETDIQDKTRVQIDQDQRDYYLREQMKVIREELGEGDENTEFSEYEKNILLLNLPQESETKLLKDLERLKK